MKETSCPIISWGIWLVNYKLINTQIVNLCCFDTIISIMWSIKFINLSIPFQHIILDVWNIVAQVQYSWHQWKLKNSKRDWHFATAKKVIGSEAHFPPVVERTKNMEEVLHIMMKCHAHCILCDEGKSAHQHSFQKKEIPVH